MRGGNININDKMRAPAARATELSPLPCDWDWFQCQSVICDFRPCFHQKTNQTFI